VKRAPKTINSVCGYTRLTATIRFDIQRLDSAPQVTLHCFNAERLISGIKDATMDPDIYRLPVIVTIPNRFPHLTAEAIDADGLAP
jgi:hypothetical protein